MRNETRPQSAGWPRGEIALARSAAKFLLQIADEINVGSRENPRRSRLVGTAVNGRIATTRVHDDRSADTRFAQSRDDRCTVRRAEVVIRYYPVNSPSRHCGNCVLRIFTFNDSNARKRSFQPDASEVTRISVVVEDQDCSIRNHSQATD